tara:strand:+ start:169 stop:450 length:282 start_codon:yes stop_codon:yes gene_type:complete
MLNIASIDIDNIKDTPDCWVMIDILKAGYKEALNSNDQMRKQLQKNDSMSDLAYARYQALKTSFNESIVQLEKLEKHFDKLDKEHTQAMEGAF